METSLIKCLDYCKLPVLPKSYDGKSSWIRAIVLVEKNDGSSNYAIASNVFGTCKIEKDFGASAIITKVRYIYPFEYVEEPVPAPDKETPKPKKKTKSKSK